MARRIRTNLNSVKRNAERNALKAAINNSLRAYISNPQSNANLRAVNNATKALIKTYVEEHEEQQASANVPTGNGGNIRRPNRLLLSNKPHTNNGNGNAKEAAKNITAKANAGAIKRNNGNPLGVGNLVNNGMASAGKSKYNGITTKLNSMKSFNERTLNALKRAVNSNANSNAKTAMLQKIAAKRANLITVRNVAARAITAVKNANTEARVKAVEAASNAATAAQAARNAKTAAEARNAEQRAREAANRAAKNAAAAKAAAEQIATNEAASAAAKKKAANNQAAANKAAQEAANAAKAAAAAASGRNKLRVAAAAARGASLLKLAGNAGASRRNALLKAANTSIFNGFVSEITGTYGATDPLYKIRGRVNASSNLNNTQKGNLRQKISNARLGTFKRNVAKATTISDINGRIAKHLQSTSRTYKILTNNHKAEAAAYLKNKRQSLNGSGPSPNAPKNGGPNNINPATSVAELEKYLRLIEGRKKSGKPLPTNANFEKRVRARLNVIRPPKKGLFGHIGGAAKYVAAGTAHHATRGVKAAAGVAAKGVKVAVPLALAGAAYLGQQGARRGFNVTVGGGKKPSNKIPNTKIGNKPGKVARIVQKNENIAAARKAYQQSVGGNASENAMSAAGAFGALAVAGGVKAAAGVKRAVNISKAVKAGKFTAKTLRWR